MRVKKGIKISKIKNKKHPLVNKTPVTVLEGPIVGYTISCLLA
jgi:hypothetical protein